MSLAHVLSGSNPAQKNLFQLEPEFEQQAQAAWLQDTQKLSLRKQRDQDKARERINSLIKSNSLLPIDTKALHDLLHAPVLNYQPSELDVQAEAAEYDDPVIGGSYLDLTGGVELTDQVIYALHDKLLEYSLSILKTRGNVKEKQETLAWIFSPDITGWDYAVKNGVRQQVPIYRIDQPFTFQACCRYSGMDYSRLRDELRKYIPDLIDKLGFSEQEKQ